MLSENVIWIKAYLIQSAKLDSNILLN